jgi:pantoate kinase
MDSERPPPDRTADGRRARAHAPGSLTLLFVPAADPDGGSLGVSLAVEDGVAADVHVADGPPDDPVADGPPDDPVADRAGPGVVRVDGEPRSFEPVERALATLLADADVDAVPVVDLAPELPIGYGIGASGAATLATALAVDEAFGLGRSRTDLVDVAHRAEVAAATGLGDVFVQARGGVVWNAGDGRGVRRVERTDRLSYAALGGLATSEVLGDAAAIDRVRAAGRGRLAAIDGLADADLRDLLDLAWGFARDADLATDRVRRAVARVERAGGAATMAMLGETVVGTPDDAFDAVTRVTPDGARLVRR